ncbi:hypothetical protein AB0L00_38595 [Actinoallomurus sp. NPDC052308]|uniref:hypothetical protein n=1 Tax=Actinoallomurus sp. NPDC052308 TaxID=3155530 RepID=UPI0034384017
MGPAACVEVGAAVMDEDRTLWMLKPGTGTRESSPIGRLAPSGRFQPFTTRSAGEGARSEDRAAASVREAVPWRDAPVVAPAAISERASVSRAYARARREFGLPATYRFTRSHAEALERLTALASYSASAGGRAQGVNWSAFARLVNLDWGQTLLSDAWSAVVKGGDLPKLLSVARLARDVHGTDFTIEQLTTVRRLADAVRADATANVLSRRGRAPGNEVRLDDLLAVVQSFGGIEPGTELTVEDAVALADLVPGVAGAGPVTVEALRHAWRAAAEALRDDAAVLLNQAMPAVAELGPALAVLGPDADGHRAEVERRFGALTELVAASWRPNQLDRVEAAWAALAALRARVTEIHAAAVASLDDAIGARLNTPAEAAYGRPEELEALRGRFAVVERAGGAAAVNELLEIRAELGSLAAPPPEAPAVEEAGTPSRPARRLPGRVLFEAARNEHLEGGEAVQPIPWGEWGRVARVGETWLGADRELAEQAAALVPEALRQAVTDGLIAEFERLGGVEAGRRLASPQGLSVPTSRGPATVRLVLGPLIGAHGAVYRRPEEVQSVQVAARPSQALDLPQIVTPSTFSDFSDNRSIAPETSNDGLISIATGWKWMSGLGLLPTLTGRGSRSFGSYEGAVTATVQQIWHDRYAYFDVPANHEEPEIGSRWSVTFTGEQGAQQTASAPVDVLLAFAEDESPEAPGPDTPMVAELPAEPPEEMTRAFHSVLWRVTTIVESLVPLGGPDAAAEEITRRFPDADATFTSAVRDLFTDSMLFAVSKDVLGHGYLSAEFRVKEDGEDWAAFRLRGRLTSLRRVDVSRGYVQQDARHLFWSGESGGMSGGVSSGVQFAPTFPGFSARGTPITIGPMFSAGPGGSVNRSLAASMGAGDWRYLGYPSQRRVYRLEMNLPVDVRSSRSAAAGLVRLALVGYVEVPEREADRFERELAGVIEGLDLYPADGAGRAVVPADGRPLTDRTPPPGILMGRSRGPSVVDMLGGFERVIPRAMSLIHGAFGDARLATLARPLTARQRHRLERALTQRFSVMAALPYTSRLISHRMSFTRLYQANGGRLRLTVLVRSEQGGDWTGDRLEWGRIDHYPISYSDLGASEEVAAQLTYRGGGHLRLGPLHGALRTTNFTGRYTYGRSRSGLLTARAGVWSSLGFVYEGPVRVFMFGTEYHVEVKLTFEPEAASGGLLTATALGVARRVLTGRPEPATRTIRRHAAIPGLMRYAVAEGLSPLTGGAVIPRSPQGDLGRSVVRRRPVTGPAVPERWSEALRAPETLRPDDQPLEVLGVAELWRVAAELLEAAGVAERTYADTLDVTINEDQLIGRMMWGGPVVQASGLVHGGTVGDRHAVISLQGRTYGLRRQAGGARMRETDILDSEPAVIFTGRRSTSHAVSGSGDWAGTREDGGPFGGWTFRNVAETHIDSNEVLSGRWITQENRDYRPHRGTMLWDVTVTSWSANAAGTWSVRQDTMQILVAGGVMVLRPAPQPPVERPPGVPRTLRPDLIPLVSASDRLEWPGLQHAPDGLNPVLDMIRGVLGAVDRRLLHQRWTIVNGTPTAARTGLPTSLHTIVEHNALLGHRDTLLGPGLILHLAESLPGANEQVSLVLRADPTDGRDYEYEDTRSRDFAVYRLNTQRRARRRGVTSAHTAGGNFGTTRIPPVSRATEGSYLEGVAESDFYEQATSARGEIFRTRDVLTVLGDTHAYTGGLRISATVYRGYNPSKVLQVLTLGLANSGFALVLDPNTPVPVAVTDHVDVVERVQFPAAMLPGPPPDPVPAGERVRRVASAATPEEVLTNAGHTLFPVDRDLILSRGVVPGGIDPLALRALFDHSIAIFNGTAPGATTPASVVNLMAATGGPFEAYAALLSRHQFLSGFHLSLGDGQVFPSLVREDGPATDARGELSNRVRFYDPQPLGWVDAQLTSESLHMAENDLLDAAGSTFGLSADGGPALAPDDGNPVMPVDASASLGQSHDHGGTAGERIVRPVAFRRRTHYLRVRVGVLAGLTIDAVNERRDIRYGAGQTRLWYTLDDSLEVLLDPETALAIRMLHGSTGIPTPHGRYLPNVPATAPAAGSPEAGQELRRLRAAFALPRYGDWYPFVGTYDPQSASVVTTSVRYDPDTRRTDTVTDHFDAARFADLLGSLEDLGERPIVLVMGGVDGAFAAEVARTSGHDLLFTTDDVHQDTAVRASLNGRPGHWRYVPAGGGPQVIHGEDLEQVLTHQIAPGLRATRADDLPGTMTPNPTILWAAERLHATTADTDSHVGGRRPGRASQQQQVMPPESRPGPQIVPPNLPAEFADWLLWDSAAEQIDWWESSYSDGEACVSIAVVGRGARRASGTQSPELMAVPPRR